MKFENIGWVLCTTLGTGVLTDYPLFFNMVMSCRFHRYL